MKKSTRIVLTAAFALSILSAGAQQINWANSSKEEKNVVHANIGLDYGVTFGLGYGRLFNTRLFPIVANIEFSIPSGKNILDDFKTKVGGQVRWFEFHHVQFSTRVYGVFRRYETNLVQIANFGSDLSAIIGYYRPAWFVSGEVGFDKSIITRLEHTKAYQNINKDVANGWYEPSTGGNFYYGIMAGYSFRENDFNVRLGRILSQDFKTAPMLPYLIQLGYNRRF